MLKIKTTEANFCLRLYFNTFFVHFVRYYHILYMVIAKKNNIQDIVVHNLTLKNQETILILTRACLGFLSKDDERAFLRLRQNVK